MNQSSDVEKIRANKIESRKLAESAFRTIQTSFVAPDPVHFWTCLREMITHARIELQPTIVTEQSKWPEFDNESTEVTEAIELCDEILELVDQLPDSAEEFAEGVQERTESIREWITDNAHVTEHQQKALTNMKAGCERWLN